MNTYTTATSQPLFYFLKATILLIFLSVLFFPNVMVGQQGSNKVDSLRALIETENSVKEKVNLYSELLDEMRNSNDPKMSEVREELTAYAEQNDYPRGIAFAKVNEGLLKMSKGEANQAIEDFNIAKGIFEKEERYANVISMINNIGICYERMGQPEMMKKSYDEALAVAERVGEDELLVQAYNAQGGYWGNRGELEKGLGYLDKGLEIVGGMEDKRMLPHLLFNKGRILSYSEPAKAKEVLDEAELILLEKENYYFLSYIRQSQIHVLDRQGKYAEAIEVVFKNLAHGEKTGDVNILVNAYSNLADLYKSQYDKGKAEESLEKMLALTRENGMIDFEMVALTNLGILFYEEEDFEKAKGYLETGSDLADSLQSYRAKLDLLPELGFCYYSLGEIEKARKCFNETLERNNGEDPHKTQKAHLGMGVYYTEKGNFNKAQKYLQNVYDYADENKEFSLKRRAVDHLANLEKTRNNYKKALKWTELQLALADSVRVSKNRDQLTTQRLSAEFEKEKEIIALEQEQQEALLKAETKQTRTAAAGIGGIALLVFGFFWNARRKNKTITVQNKQLNQLNDTKDRIFSIIGHDLRKPAISFKDLSETIHYLLNKKDYTRLEKLATEMEKDTYSLYKLTDNLLSWALMQRDVMPYNPMAVAPADVAEETVELFSRVAQNKQIELTSEVPANLKVYADPNALSTIVRNLVDNALKYTDNGGHVTITAKPSDKGVILQIADNGQGIPADKLDNIFLLQKNKSEKGTAGEKGTGLGLHLINELVKLNKGAIDVVSQLGQGTKFEVMMPAVEM